VDPLRGLGGQLDDVLVAERINEGVRFRCRVEHLEPLAKFADLRPAVLLEVLLDPLPEFSRRPAQVRLEDLAHVHSAGDTERIEHNVDGSPVVQVRHVLLGEEA
jgi:hypothetical protein